ncbi:MAG: ATP-binding protein [Rhabdochlamydiaceae bacterium]|nr:ATP-binding protein [Candidatus Amphrikana amoebophyrae]
MKHQILKQVIADQTEYTPPKQFFERTLGKTILEFAEDPNIIIISGIRRSGKSTIQRSLQAALKEQSCFFNFDDERLIQFQVEDFQTLLEVLIEIFGNCSTFFFDEIQNINGWERFIRRLYEQGKKIFITGSNAKLLSKELGTHLTGRHIQLEAYPLSFKEIVNYETPQLFTKKNFSTQDIGFLKGLFSNYIKDGGIPEYVKFKKPEYLKDLLDGILYRDIITRYRINDEKALREVAFYLASNIGKEFSYTNLAKMVGIKSPHTISKYCDHFEQCYLFFSINRYSHSLKKQIQSNKKSYMIDPALIRVTGFRVSEDRGRLLENIVFIHLRQKTNEIYFHKEKKECDFILREGNQVSDAIQVTTSLSDTNVRKREIEGLVEAMENYKLKEGLILVENEEDIINENGHRIRIVPIYKWLLSN